MNGVFEPTPAVTTTARGCLLTNRTGRARGQDVVSCFHTLQVKVLAQMNGKVSVPADDRTVL